jgi:hypothetical protein
MPVGRQRRQERLRQRRRSVAETPPDSAAPVARGRTTSGRRRPGFLAALDPFGGLPVVLAGLGLILVVAVILWQNRPSGPPSQAPLMGDAVPYAAAAHVADEALMDVPEGMPPAAGPHFVQPQRPGIYEAPIADGNAVHALEHGIIWFTYNPDLITNEDLDVIRRVARNHANDVIVSPRPRNAEGVYVVSWGRRLLVPLPVDADVLDEFVRTNRDRSPEPGIR